MSRFYAKCEHPIIAKAIKSMESDFYNLYTEQLPFVKKTFVKLYKEYLVNNVEENIRKNQFSLANEEQIAIDYKGGTNDTD
jgi:predicted alpha/beta-fold hydrolase